jgi:multicomponent Na+:H+ antiporter subunit D
VAAALFTNFANNRINIFIGYEILTFCTFPLLNLKNDNEGHNASIKYLYNMLISALFLAIGMMLADNNDYNIKAISLLLIIIGTSKVAIIPFNSWLPAAMVAPTPVSALLHAVAVVKTGVIVIIKMVEDYFPSSILENIIINNYFVYNLIMIVISLNIIIANIKAVNLTSIKGILAQSTIINLSYIVFIIISPISDNILYGLTVLLIHAVVKICLFMLTGYLSTNYKIKEVTDLNNVAESVPWVAYGFIICILSMMGTAPVMGFISKKMLIKTINVYNIYTMLVFIFSSICAVYYYGKIIFSLYNYNEYKELSLTSKGKWMQFAITLVLLIIISSSILATYLYFKF